MPSSAAPESKLAEASLDVQDISEDEDDGRVFMPPPAARPIRSQQRDQAVSGSRDSRKLPDEQEQPNVRATPQPPAQQERADAAVAASAGGGGGGFKKSEERPQGSRDSSRPLPKHPPGLPRHARDHGDEVAAGDDARRGRSSSSSIRNDDLESDVQASDRGHLAEREAELLLRQNESQTPGRTRPDDGLLRSDERGRAGQEQQQYHSQSLNERRHSDRGTGRDRDPVVKALDEQELRELKTLFRAYDYDDSGTIERSEMMSMLEEMEYTYSPEYVDVLMRTVFDGGKHRKHSMAKLVFDEFVHFMHVFYHLDNIVVDAIEQRFEQLGLDRAHASDEHVAILSTYVRFDDRKRLDFSLMDSQLGHAVQKSTKVDVARARQDSDAPDDAELARRRALRVERQLAALEKQEQEEIREALHEASGQRRWEEEHKEQQCHGERSGRGGNSGREGPRRTRQQWQEGPGGDDRRRHEREEARRWRDDEQQQQQVSSPDDFPG